ncbi:hypothetical protein [Mycobacterium sp. 852002-51057_SCH5723018]|uniref:hypothetical protein n=1 Tax=Mycobacterium sp. 852002-51057_SCH5723018 TaxID=1834094 RepID=UPI000AFFB6A2|nr:hypothetical protein [Mycobacterium sp. 852002-51057_SCH5723018]
MTEQDLVEIELTDDEREFMVLALNEYAGTAQHTYMLLCPVLGQSDKHQWFQLTTRLKEAIKNKAPLSDLDWARAMFLTDISFGSTLVGSGVRFGRSADEYWFEILRSVQEKVSTYPRFLLLLENASYPPTE